MKLLQNKSKREKILIIGLVVSLIFGVYLTTRIKNLNANIQRMESGIQTEKQKYSKLLQETKDAKPSNILEKEIESLQSQLHEERESMKGFDLAFIDLDDTEALYALMRDITVSAEQHNLQVLGKENELIQLASLIGQTPRQTTTAASSRRTRTNNSAGNLQNNNISNNNTLKRHVFKLRLRGTFHSTYLFVKSLHDMERSILITRIKLSADDLNTYNGTRLINTELTLAI